jgi:hypothetical protein
MERENGGALGARFFLIDEADLSESVGGAEPLGPAGSRLAAARAALREAQQAEWDERQRVARADAERLTPTHAALLQARQAQRHAALAVVEDLRRRAVWLRQAIALGEEALTRQRQSVEKLRRELFEIGE